ncbi:uncharacterized protein SOCEGT47_068920 [Sorangium cellulosum]|uniref:Uncharacterized protein n=1 Tax=Sorangium cellulosum TaxID=56 RepID=A0A4P2QAL4_SORCE|nr:uncharacterized protein SOCEGT47_068920 [Sorangium cellulosum]
MKFSPEPVDSLQGELFPSCCSVRAPERRSASRATARAPRLPRHVSRSRFSRSSRSTAADAYGLIHRSWIRLIGSTFR